MKTPGIYYGVIAAFCVLTLCIGIVTAADLTQSATNCTGRPGFGHGNPPSPNEMITHLEQQGVDVTEVKTALQNGDSATVKAWLENYFQTHKPQMMTRPEYPRFDLTNVTRQQQVITKLEQQGVDVTEAKTALQNGDTASVKAWLDTYRESHKVQMKDFRMKGNLHAQAAP